MYALVDAVSFYASAEKVFDPSIRNKPVVVLTNNDGCICAVCPIARTLNIPKFGPYFKIQQYLARHKVVVRSSNYELYADLSDRMMNVVARFCDNQHIYSIDESFLQFKHYRQIIDDWHQYGQQIRQAVWRETKLPVGVGIGNTPTLAKAANHAAKKLQGFDGVAVIDSEQSRKYILAQMKASDVWGIGAKLASKLNIMGIHTALDLANQNAKSMRKQFSVVVERTVNELNGIACLTWDEVREPKQEIFSTRSFGQRITNQSALAAALVSHASIVARKVRQQHSLVKRLVVFASSSPHQDGYYKKSITVEFPQATQNTLTLASAVGQTVAQIYLPGVLFYRCGVGAIELASSQFQQPDLFAKSTENKALMRCYDVINKRYGQGTLQLASEGKQQRWQMKRQHLSPSYTTKWSDIPKIQC
ncbi:Y-family DNA polymerase [Thalassotalea sp. ND16A]|uniref:Y-family DNA polymerase n=1 Tax=Thalassotalea sp. ND16A TaxID=1535422 RepID=UPI00051A3072|nr:Y-family DNA polymerase [Thalassotalea sp. ND16A]KGJ98068.1 DNA-directed DNA polymerase [Thalassotalea sp. ND16A]